MTKLYSTITPKQLYMNYVELVKSSPIHSDEFDIST